MCRRGVRCISTKPVRDCGPSRANPRRSRIGKLPVQFRAKLRLAAEALQENQMMYYRSPHGGMLPIGNTELFGGLLYNPGQRSIVSVAHKRAQMMDYVMVEAARKPTYERAIGRIIGRGREDVINAVVKLAAA